MPTLSNGHYSGNHPGSVENFVSTAQEQQLDFIVLGADFEVMAKVGAEAGKTLWKEFQDACGTHSTPKCRAIPALLTRDAVGNRFITTGPPPWPERDWLSNPLIQPEHRIVNHLAFWESAKLAFRAPYLISEGSYPSCLYSAYRAFPLRTYVNNKLIEDQSEGLRQDQEQGNHSLIFVMTLIDQPSLLAAVPEYTYLRNDIMNCFTEEGVPGSYWSFVSNGPLIEYFEADPKPSGANRQTFGRLYCRGSERWRVNLRVRPGRIIAPLTTVIVKRSRKSYSPVCAAR